MDFPQGFASETAVRSRLRLSRKTLLVSFHIKHFSVSCWFRLLWKSLGTVSSFCLATFSLASFAQISPFPSCTHLFVTENYSVFAHLIKPFLLRLITNKTLTWASVPWEDASGVTFVTGAGIKPVSDACVSTAFGQKGTSSASPVFFDATSTVPNLRRKKFPLLSSLLYAIRHKLRQWGLGPARKIEHQLYPCNLHNHHPTRLPPFDAVMFESYDKTICAITYGFFCTVLFILNSLWK